MRSASKKGLKWQLRDLKLLKKLVKSSGVQWLKKEKQSNWGKHQTFLKANPEETEKVDQLSKQGKGLAARVWMLKKKHPSFISVASKVSTNQTLTKGEVWESEKTMLDRFGKDEFQIHLNSGRIKWREDAWGEGVFHYYDQRQYKEKKGGHWKWVDTRPRVPGWRRRPRTICQIEGQRPSQTLAWHGYLAKR